MLFPKHGFVILQTNKHIFALAHGGLEEAGVQTQDHGIQNKTNKEQQERKQEQVGRDGLMHHQTMILGAERNFFVSQGDPPLIESIQQ